jgi:hypothetical protein
MTYTHLHETIQLTYKYYISLAQRFLFVNAYVHLRNIRAFLQYIQKNLATAASNIMLALGAGVGFCWNWASLGLGFFEEEV